MYYKHQRKYSIQVATVDKRPKPRYCTFSKIDTYNVHNYTSLHLVIRRKYKMSYASEYVTRTSYICYSITAKRITCGPKHNEI